MATLIARANGDFTNSTTWGVADSTSLNLSSGVTTNISTSNSTSSAFTPGAITIDAIVLYCATRTASPTGTVTVGLYQAGVLVPGTEVIINATDLPSVPVFYVGAGIGWVVFKFSSPVTLAAATLYTVGIKSTVNSVVAFRASSTSNWVRALRTTTEASPAASDNLIISGDWTAPATVSPISVTMNNTATTAFGIVNVGTNGLLTYGTSTSTNYYLKLTGDLFVNGNGTFRIGSSGSPIPSSSTASLEFNSSGGGTYGLWVTSMATFESYGALKKSWTTLTSDLSVGETTAPVADNTGWEVGDTIVFAPTERTVAQYETKAISTIGTNTLTMASLTYAHRGTGVFDGVSLAGEVMNITRNVKIRGMSTTLTGFVQIWDTAVFSASYTEFYYLGHSSSTGKRGLTINTTTGSANFQHCANHDFYTTGVNFLIENTTTTNVTINNCAIYSQLGIDSGGLSAILTNNCIIPTSTMNGLVLSSFNGTITGNRVCGASNGIRVNASFVTTTSSVIEDNYLHTNSNNFNVASDPGVDLTFGPFYTWFSTSSNLNISSNLYSNLTFEDWVMFGNTTNNFAMTANIASYGKLVFKNLSSNNHPIHTTPTGFTIYPSTSVNITHLIFVNSFFSEVSPHTQDISYTASGLKATKIEAYNTVFTGNTEVLGQSSMGDEGYIISYNHDTVVDQIKIWRKHGNITNDNTTTPASIRLTPISNDNRLKAGSFKVPVSAGGSTIVSVKVRQSVVGDGSVYNGERPRLMLNTNYLGGIEADQVIDTATAAAEGAWETLSGSSPIVDNDCVLEFYVDCNGTTGWVNMYDFVGEFDEGVSMWSDGQPFNLAMPETSGSVGLPDIAY